MDAASTTPTIEKHYGNHGNHGYSNEDEPAKEDSQGEEDGDLEGYSGEKMVFDDNDNESASYKPRRSSSRSRRGGSRRGRRGSFAYEEDPDEDNSFKYGDRLEDKKLEGAKNGGDRYYMRFG